MPADDLYRLVGVPADVPVDRLRAAYERAVSAATRSGDHQRALELSTAFDALPAATKAQVYRNSRHGAGANDPWHRPGPDAYRTEFRPPRRAGRAPRRPRRGSRPGSSRAGFLRRLLLLAAVALVTGFVVYLALFDRTNGAASPGMAPAVVLTR